MVAIGLRAVLYGRAAGELPYAGVTVGAAVAAFLGASRRRHAERMPWICVGSGLAFSALGDVIYAVEVQLLHMEADVSIADAAWLASYVAIAAGLLVLLNTARRGERGDVDGMIDMAAVGVLGLLVVWQLSVQATVFDSSVSPFVRAVWAAYPILDVALFALVIRILSNRSTRSVNALLLAAGVGSWLFSDTAYMLWPSGGAFTVLLDAGWMAGAALLGTAAWPRPGAVRRVEPSARVGAWSLAVAILPLLVPGVIELVGYVNGADANPIPLLLATIALVALTSARAARLLRSTQAAHAELLATERHFRALVQRSSDAAFVMDVDGRIRYVSAAILDQFGYSPEELIGCPARDLVHPDDLGRAAEFFSEVRDTPGAHAAVELRFKDAHGEWRWVEDVVTNLVDEPSVRGLVANIRDISARKAAEDELARLAHYDSLTGLPNRWLLMERLRSAIDGEHPVALLVIDLDQFKLVNDSRGHATGDRLLQLVGERLRFALGPGDTLARMGGDEFAVLTQNAGDDSVVTALSDRLQQTLRDPFDLERNGRFYVAASIGIGMGHPGAEPDQLLREADAAMYAAKTQGRSRSTIFDEQFRKDAEERLSIEADLRNALENDELVVHYQPVVDIGSGTIAGVEALVRWHHPTRGFLLPGTFIPIAERSALIDALGAFVVGRACADAARWARSGTRLSVAVNVSASNLPHAAIVETVRSALLASGLPPELLVLEVTESALMAGRERALGNLRALRATGAHVALDDFGTGYSSLAYLKDVPADIVKIDRSFVQGVAIDPVDRDIVAAVVDLARALGRTVVAEGVEEADQLAALRRLNCPLGQGFLWGPAVPADEVPILTRRPQAHRVS